MLFRSHRSTVTSLRYSSHVTDDPGSVTTPVVPTIGRVTWGRRSPAGALRLPLVTPADFTRAGVESCNFIDQRSDRLMDRFHFMRMTPT